MITVEEKLNAFSKMVFEKAQDDANKKITAIREKNEQILEDHKQKVEQEGQKIIEKRKKEGENQKRRMISKAHTDIKKSILDKKQELFNRLIEGIHSRAERFTIQRDYEDFLIDMLRRMLSSTGLQEGIVIYVRPKDIEHYRDTLERTIEEQGYKAEYIKIKTTSENIIGGLILVNEEAGIRLDGSIRMLIENHKESIGQLFYRELEKAGDSYE